ncbi:MAG: hypothetical protein IKI64_06210 [Clostridia bacterium]|nr:hypothetical protein [Clostridia bacterium]
MPNPSQNAGNRGNPRRTVQSGGSLNNSARPMQTVPEEAKKEERSPLLLLARRIREEQGADGLKAFLIAMEPFAAPFELKNLAVQFGMEHHVRAGAAQGQVNAYDRNAAFSSPEGGFSAQNNGGFNMNGMNGTAGTGGMGGAQQNRGMGFDPNLFRMMQMMNGAGSGGMGNFGGNNGGNMNQMMQLMQLMRLLPMLQNMGKGGADISQIMKMMNM